MKLPNIRGYLRKKRLRRRIMKNRRKRKRSRLIVTLRESRKRSSRASRDISMVRRKVTRTHSAFASRNVNNIKE